MQRRDFMKALGAGAVTGIGLTGLAGCGDQSKGGKAAGGKTGFKQEYSWRMVTTWPPNFPGLGTGAARLAKTIETLSGGRIGVKVYGANELVPPMEVFDTVSRGSAQLGHGAAYYWKGKAPAAQFFAAVPFGMNAQEINAWFYYGDGLKLWREVYKPFGVRPFPAGNTGVQMGGWFRKKINGVADLKGLKMRIPGLGGEVLSRAGGIPVSLAGGEILTALQTGAIDATEWVGPYNDLAFGLYQAAPYYYYPGWHEPGSALECIVNEKAFQQLPPDLQAVVETACQAVNLDMLAEFTARNHVALKTLKEKHHVEVLPFPDSVLAKLHDLSQQVLTDLAADDPQVKKVYDNYRSFQNDVRAWHEISERAYYRARDLT